MESLLADAAAAGAVLATHSRLLGASQVPGPISMAGPTSITTTTTSSSSSRAMRPLLQLDVQDVSSGDTTQLVTRWCINAAGLSAQAVAASIRPVPAHIPQQHLAKGNYFSLVAGKAPFSRLIYPIPEDGGLGVHLTLDLAGQARFGPDVEWVGQSDDYSVDPQRAQAFYPAIRSYYPALQDGSLQPSYCGIRPKLSGPGDPAADFVIQGPRDHGVRGLVNLYGIESPGLTSSLAFAKVVAGMLQG
jgi:L-2-hydroxyglutarate oxidase LhgO